MQQPLKYLENSLGKNNNGMNSVIIKIRGSIQQVLEKNDWLGVKIYIEGERKIKYSTFLW